MMTATLLTFVASSFFRRQPLYTPVSRSGICRMASSAPPSTPDPLMVAKAARIDQALKSVYPVAPKGFLKHSSSYTLLISVLLSAQSLDTKVNEITPTLFKHASTPEEMVALGEDKIRQFIRQIGLAPQKAKNIYKLSQILAEQHESEVPQTFEQLEALPGVGHKTASVVMMQAFNKPAFPVDTHIHRLACRWGCGAKSVAKTEKNLKLWFPDESSWGELHTRIILFGREYCPARKHDMDACPICCFAATDEARTLNRQSPNKFVGSEKHSDPFSIRDVEPVKREEEEDKNTLKKVFTKKRKKRQVASTKKKPVKAEAEEQVDAPVLRRSKRQRRKVVKVDSSEENGGSDDDFTV